MTMRTNSRYLVLQLAMPAAILLLASCGGNGGQQAMPSGNSSNAGQLQSLQALLDSELERLAVDTSRESSIAPSTGNAVFDLQASVTTVVPGEQADVTLRWTERLVGDYDRNGLVNAADLVPLAQHFGEIVSYRSVPDTGGIEGWPTGLAYAPEDAANWRLARIDGNMDGEINAGDVTPIAQHWQQSLSGYRVYRQHGDQESAELLAGPQETLGLFSVERSAPDDNNSPVTYIYSDTLTDAGEYLYYVAAYDPDSAAEGPPSRPVRPVLNSLPIASLQADPPGGSAPLQVSLDASGSGDADGEIVLYEFDLDGNGSYETAGADPDQQATYGGGSHLVRLRVTDDSGAVALDELTLKVDDPIFPVVSVDRLEDSVPAIFTFSAAGSELGGPLALCEWYVDTGTQPAQSSTELQDLELDTEEVGEHIIRLVLTGTDGQPRVASQAVRVFEAPHAEFYTGGVFAAGVQSGFYASTSKGHQLSYEWDVDAPWLPGSSPENFDVYGLGYELYLVPGGPGGFTLSLRVTDAFGKTDLTSSEYVAISLPEPEITLSPLTCYTQESSRLQINFSGSWQEFVSGYQVSFPDGGHAGIPGSTFPVDREILWEEPGSFRVVVEIDGNAFSTVPPGFSSEFMVEVLDFSPALTVADPNRLAQLGFLLDGTASSSEFEVAGYDWDLDGNGSVDQTTAEAQLFHVFSPGTHEVTMWMRDGSGLSRGASTSVLAAEDHLLIVRNDDGIYQANLDALLTDLDAIGISWQLRDYADDLRFALRNDGAATVLWYRGGPGDALEPSPYLKQWTATEIENYVGLMTDGRSVLLVSQSHGMDSEYDNDPPYTMSGWQDWYSATPLASTVPQQGRLHALASGLATDDILALPGTVAMPTSPTNVLIAGNRILQGGGNGAHRYDAGHGSSGKRLLSITIDDPVQVCGVGFYYNGFNYPISVSSYFSYGLALDYEGLPYDWIDSGRVEWGCRRAPMQLDPAGPGYNWIPGNARLWVVGYPWAKVNVSSSSPSGMQRHEVLQNILGWLTEDYYANP
ncbi:hypothetical protein KDL44_10160 [bacterium]|nr:hypothetical protein [bacterium]